MADQEQLVTIKDVFTMVTKLVGQQEAIHARNLMADQIHTDHEQRIRSLEKWRYSVPASLLVSLGSVATALVSVFVHNH